jgi:hypothetical protein
MNSRTCFPSTSPKPWNSRPNLSSPDSIQVCRIIGSGCLMRSLYRIHLLRSGSQIAPARSAVCSARFTLVLGLLHCGGPPMRFKGFTLGDSASSAVCSWALSALFTLLLWLEIVGIDCGNPPMRSKGSTLGAHEYC